MLLSAESLTHNGKTILKLWFIGAKEPRYVEAPFQPYFYSLKPFRNSQQVKKRFLSDLEEHRIYQVFFDDVNEIERWRSASTFEDNVPFIQRIAIDKGFAVLSEEPKILSWDLESFAEGVNPNPTQDTIRSIAAYPSNFFEKGREEAIKAFLTHVSTYDPDIIVDFYGRFYDFPLLMSECKKLAITCRIGRKGSQPYILKREFERRQKGKTEHTIRIDGRAHFDVHKEVDADYSLTRAGLKGRGLNEVAQHFGLNPIMNVDHASIPEERLKEVNLDDARCAYEIALVYLQMLFELAEYLSIPLNMVIDRSPSHIPNFIYGRDYNKKGIISDGSNFERFPNLFGKRKKAHQGAFNACYETGNFSPITHYDYSSFYICIMIALNLDPETVKLLKVKPYTGKYSFEDHGNYAIVEVPDKVEDIARQVVCRIDLSFDSTSRIKLKEILEKRKVLNDEYKKTKNQKAYSQSLALKLVGNLCWGYQSMKHSRWGSLPVGILISALARYIIQNTIKARKAKVIQASTDGWYETNSQSNEMLDLTTILPKCFDLSILKIGREDYDAMLSIDEKDYVLYQNGKIYKYGSGLLGKHHTSIEDVFADDLCLAIFEKKEFEPVLRKYDDLTKFSMRDFVLTTTVSKNPHEYTETTMYANLVRQYKQRNIQLRWGNKIRYVKTLKGYVPVEFASSIDYNYYKLRLAMLAERILRVPAKKLLPLFSNKYRRF